jgi:hypothetical protein
MQVLTTYEAVKRVLEDPAYVVPPAAPAPTGLAGLRSHAARFSSGAQHAERRARAVARLAAIDPEQVRAEARRRARAGEALGDIVVNVLAEALGLADVDPADVHTVASVYALGQGGGAVCDAAADRLVHVPKNEAPRWTEAMLLVQAAGATTKLLASRDCGNLDAAVPGTRRLDPAGELVELDFVAANRGRGDREPLNFGGGAHRCPGQAHAWAIAAGVREALSEAARSSPA